MPIPHGDGEWLEPSRGVHRKPALLDTIDVRRKKHDDRHHLRVLVGWPPFECVDGQAGVASVPILRTGECFGESVARRWSNEEFPLREEERISYKRVDAVEGLDSRS
jgi:hypothetical protein